MAGDASDPECREVSPGGDQGNDAYDHAAALVAKSIVDRLLVIARVVDHDADDADKGGGEEGGKSGCGSH